MINSPPAGQIPVIITPTLCVYVANKQPIKGRNVEVTFIKGTSYNTSNGRRTNREGAELRNILRMKWRSTGWVGGTDSGTIKFNISLLTYSDTSNTTVLLYFPIIVLTIAQTDRQTDINTLVCERSFKYHHCARLTCARTTGVDDNNPPFSPLFSFSHKQSVHVFTQKTLIHCAVVGMIFVGHESSPCTLDAPWGKYSNGVHRKIRRSGVVTTMYHLSLFLYWSAK